jgi:hypothetical protein
MQIILAIGALFVASAEGKHFNLRFHQNRCPDLSRCTDVCKASGQPICGDEETCVTEPSVFKTRRTECQGCDVFVRCESMDNGRGQGIATGEPNPSTPPPGTTCPVNSCLVPCEDEFGQPRCGPEQTCITDPNSFLLPDGTKCFGCPIFLSCEDKKLDTPPPRGEVCPVNACIIPCEDEFGQHRCDESYQVCVTDPNILLLPDGTECFGCPIFMGCEAQQPPPPSCPQVKCKDPCFDYDLGAPRCSADQKCIANDTFMEINGQQCPMCRAFSHCA